MSQIIATKSRLFSKQPLPRKVKPDPVESITHEVGAVLTSEINFNKRGYHRQVMGSKGTVQVFFPFLRSLRFRPIIEPIGFVNGDFIGPVWRRADRFFDGGLWIPESSASISSSLFLFLTPASSEFF